MKAKTEQTQNWFTSSCSADVHVLLLNVLHMGINYAKQILFYITAQDCGADSHCKIQLQHM